MAVRIAWMLRNSFQSERRSSAQFDAAFCSTVLHAGIFGPCADRRYLHCPGLRRLPYPFLPRFISPLPGALAPLRFFSAEGEKAERNLRMDHPDWDPYLWKPSSTALARRGGGIILPDHDAALISGSPNSWVTLFYSCRRLVAANSVSIICKQNNITGTQSQDRDSLTAFGSPF